MIKKKNGMTKIKIYNIRYKGREDVRDVSQDVSQSVSQDDRMSGWVFNQ